MKKKRYYKLQNVVLLGFSVLAVILIISISAIIGSQYIEKEMDSVSETAFGYTRAAAEYIDGDTIAGYVETEEKDDYYYEVLEYLNILQANSSLYYYYVFVPYEDDLVYIWDADTYEPGCELGQHEEYMLEGKAAVEEIYRQDPPENILISHDDTYGYIASAFSPVFDSAGNPVAVAGVDIYMPGLESEIFHFLINVVLAIIIIVLVTILLFFLFAKKQIVNPINVLRSTSRSMVDNLENNDVIHIDIKARNEIGELSNSFNQMYYEVKNYIERLSAVTAEKERIGTELALAAKIQADMLPCIFPAFPDVQEFDIYATMDPAKEVGGDFYDFFMVDDRHLAIVMADVSGKGVPAALFMVIGKTLIKDHTRPGVSLGDVFSEVNDMLCDANSEGLFITAFEGVLDLDTGEFRYVNAGHEPPYICRAGGDYELYKVRPGFVLAGLEGMHYKEGSLTLESGDRIFLYTDGVPEAENLNHDLFDSERLSEALNRHKNDRLDDMLHNIRHDVDIFTGGAEQFDDITMLCLEYRK